MDRNLPLKSCLDILSTFSHGKRLFSDVKVYLSGETELIMMI